MQILPGLYLINGYPFSQHQNGYALKTGGGYLFFDSGDLETKTFSLVQKNCEFWDIPMDSSSHLLITHPHFDHSSHAIEFRSRGAKIIASSQTADAIGAGDDRCVGYALHREFPPCATDILVRHNDILDFDGVKVRCIEAPGHADGCMIYEVELHGYTVWFTGDVIMMGHECQSAQPGWNGGPDYNRSTYRETLEKLSKMKCDCIMPGHGPCCIGNGRRFFENVYTMAMMEWR